MSEGSSLVMNALFIGKVFYPLLLSRPLTSTRTTFVLVSSYLLASPQTAVCLFLCNIVGFVESNYKGREVIDGIETHVFEKLDHFYYASGLRFILIKTVADLGRPIRVYAPLDPQRNRENDQYFGTFRSEPVDPSRFAIPSYCNVVSATTDEWASAKMDGAFKAAADTCFGTGGPPGTGGGPPPGTPGGGGGPPPGTPGGPPL
jgi:hypothetical protein